MVCVQYRIISAKYAPGQDEGMKSGALERTQTAVR